MKKIIIYLLVALVLVTVAILFTNRLMNREQNTIATNSNNIQENVSMDSKQNNSISEPITAEFENEDEETITNEPQKENTEIVDTQTVKKEETSQEKAINLAKEHWGEDNKVYFSFDRIDEDGKYIICVRDKETTVALNWYTVNVETEELTVE